MTTWEYKQEVIPADPAQVQACCGERGKDGWELAAIVPVMLAPPASMQSGRIIQPQAQPGLLLQFKRPVAETAEGEMSECVNGLDYNGTR